MCRPQTNNENVIINDFYNANLYFTLLFYSSPFRRQQCNEFIKRPTTNAVVGQLATQDETKKKKINT